MYALRPLFLFLVFGLALTAHAQTPNLQFSTYLGGSALDLSTGLALDADGNVWVAGTTLSDDFPTATPVSAYQGGLIGSDAFLAKLGADGAALVYATHLGGTGEEVVTSMVIDSEGRPCLAGSSTSDAWLTTNPIHPFRGGDQLFTDAFLACVSADGAVVDVATPLGGSGDETITAMAVGPDGSLYVTGTTTSRDFPVTAGVVQPTYAGDADLATLEAFVAKLRPQNGGYALDFATYLGGAGEEIPQGIAVDAEGNVWVGGVTTSADFPTVQPLQADYAGPIRDLEGDVFLARLAADGSALDMATYLGGGQNDQITGLALDGDGRLVATGWTQSGDFPTTPGVWQSEWQGLRERFVLRLMPVGEQWMLDYSTRLGSAGGFEMGRAGLAVDLAGRVYVAGATVSEAFPTQQAIQPFYAGGEADAFLARVDGSGSDLGFATYLGGSEADVVTGLALQGNTLCLTGSTGSGDFPTQAALQPIFDGPPTTGLNLTSVFVTCYAIENEASVLTAIDVNPAEVDLIARETVTFSALGVDQFGQPLGVDVAWTTTSGSIDENGVYTAGDEAGVFSVSATESTSGLVGTAVVNIISGVGTEDSELPDAFALYSNYPNPFNPQTTIRFDVKASAHVVLTLYDTLGRKQATLVERDYAAGRHAVRFDGRGWPSGVYFYEIEMGDFRAVRQMVLLR